MQGENSAALEDDVEAIMYISLFIYLFYLF